jgi:hypothetical protein
MQGICFIEPLLRLVALGIKTQTRRIVHPQPLDSRDWKLYQLSETTVIERQKYRGKHFWALTDDTDGIAEVDQRYFLPRYKAGERLYLKEPYYYEREAYGFTLPEPIVHYKLWDEWKKFPWRNKLFMPAEYARYIIEVTSVRAERLQAISDEDCRKEGIMESDRKGVFLSTAVQHTTGVHAGICKAFDTPQAAYAALIDKINGKGTWSSNPYVWVYEYTPINHENAEKQDSLFHLAVA